MYVLRRVSPTEICFDPDPFLAIRGGKLSLIGFVLWGLFCVFPGPAIPSSRDSPRSLQEHQIRFTVTLIIKS